MGRTHGRAPIGQWCFCARGTCGGCGQRLLDVFETSLQEAITKRRRANDSDLSSDDEELGDRIWELIYWEPSKEEAIAAANNARSNLLNHQTTTVAARAAAKAAKRARTAAAPAPAARRLNP